jgi:hypothetical protein
MHSGNLALLSACAAWADLFDSFLAFFDLGENVLTRGRPHEGLGVLVV